MTVYSTNPEWPKQEPERDEEWIARRFGDVGEPPSNEVVVDEDAEPAPNIGHPQ